MSTYKIEAATGQHIGDREEQQDRTAIFAAPNAPGYLLAIMADGMGALSSGAMAAEQVIRSAKQIFDHFSPLTDEVHGILQSIAGEADTIIKLSAVSSETKPHSTIVILILTPQKTAVWTHAGNSRLYRFAGPNCAYRTTDHSYLEQLKSQDKFDKSNPKNPSFANLLVNVLGSHSRDLTLDIHYRENLKAGDAFMLCTDGLWRHFSDAELGAAIAMNSTRQACEMLINKAKERAEPGKADNCTLSVVKLVKPMQEAKQYTIDKMRRAG